MKASIVTNNRPAPGGQFVLHARALPDNPYDGHTLREVIDPTETLTGCTIERAYVDKGYRGHDAQNPRRIFISGQKRGVFGVIRRELRRRSAIEPIIGHLKAEGHLGRCYLRRQRRPLRRRPQFPPRPRLAERTLVPVPTPAMARCRHPSTAQLGFLKDDQTMRGSPTRNRAFACGCLRWLRYAGDGDMAAAATSLSRDLRSWSCGSGSIPIVDKMCSQR